MVCWVRRKHRELELLPVDHVIWVEFNNASWSMRRKQRVNLFVLRAPVVLEIRLKLVRKCKRWHRISWCKQHGVSMLYRILNRIYDRNIRTIRESSALTSTWNEILVDCTHNVLAIRSFVLATDHSCLYSFRICIVFYIWVSIHQLKVDNQVRWLWNLLETVLKKLIGTTLSHPNSEVFKVAILCLSSLSVVP